MRLLRRLLAPKAKSLAACFEAPRVTLLVRAWRASKGAELLSMTGVCDGP